MIKRPNPFLWFPLAGILKISAYFQGDRVVEKVKIKRPSILLSNHTSFNDYVYTTAAAYPKRVNYLAAAKMFHEPSRRPFLKLSRAIPKCAFQADLRSVVSAFEVLKQKGIVGIFPEGQIAYHGASLRPPFSIAKFLKKAGVDVYLVQHKNVYLMAPPWATKTFKGPVFTTVRHLFTPEQLKQMDEKAVFEVVEKNLHFNTGEYNREHKHRYKVQDIDNLENLIYECPNCGHDGLIADGHFLKCPKCHREMEYDVYGELGGQSIYDHYERQRKALESKIATDPNYQLSAPVTLVRYKGNGLAPSGEGVLTLDREAYVYNGTDKGQQVTYRFSTKTIEYLPTDIGQDVQIYDNYEVYQFYMKDKILPTIFCIAGEYFYQLKTTKPADMIPKPSSDNKEPCL